MVHGLGSLLGLAARQVEREHARMVAAEARLADANKLLWDWVAGDWSEEGAAPDFDADPDRLRGAAMKAGWDLANHRRLMELAAILGEDVSPKEVQYKLRQRASKAAADAQGPLCVCGHERALHPQGGRCIGSHRRGGCASFATLAESIAP
jgi:hypothetical protein